jgi:hypothetical protein
MAKSGKLWWLDDPFWLRVIGGCLFCASFLVPLVMESGGFGYQLFVAVPGLVLYDVVYWRELSFASVGLHVALVAGWFANLLIFSPLKEKAARIAAALPWLCMLAMVFAGGIAQPSWTWLTAIPFYPWAVGIALIQRSHIMYHRQVKFALDGASVTVSAP